MESLNIIFFAASLNYGGAERQLVTLAKGLHKKGHRVRVALYYSGGPLEQILHTSGIQVDILEKRGRWDNILFLWKLVLYFRKNRTAIVHSYLVAPNILSAIARLFVPRIKIVWGVRASNMDLRKYDIIFRIAFFLSCKLSSLPNLIIVNSEAGMKFHQRNGYPIDYMRVIHNGIDTEKLYQDNHAGKRIRASLGYTDKDIVIGIVGRIDPMKDHATFISAAGMLHKKDKRLKFLCIGDGPEDLKSKLILQAKMNGLHEPVLQWIGNQDDMKDVYNTLNVLTSSSAFGEGFSNVIGEAMACGVPCVATDVGDSALIIGKHGIIVPPNDSTALYQGLYDILSMAQDRSKALRQSVRDRVVNKFNIDRLVTDTESVLSEMR